jgi:VIT1/CCC1 family predicted Fe2+/Mn2+ transporter
VLTCDVSSLVNTSASVNVKIFVDGVQKVQDYLTFEDSDWNVGGLIFFGFLLILTIGIFFMESKEGLVIATIFGFIVLIALGIVKGKIIGITSGVIWLIIVGIILIIKLNGERQ